MVPAPRLELTSCRLGDQGAVALGEAVQGFPIKPMLKAPGINPLKP